MVKVWVICPHTEETLGGASSGFTLLVVFVYGAVNMTGVDFVKEGV